MKKGRMKFLIITGLFMLCVSGCSNPNNSSSSTDVVVTSLITFDKQGGTGGSNTVVATLNQSMPEATAPTKEGYTFLGYSDGKSGGNLYYDSVMGSHKNWDKTKDTTLYAQWEDSTYYTQGLVFECYLDYEYYDGDWQEVGCSYSVAGYNGSSPVVIIPSTYEGSAVDWIEDEAFKDKKHITSIYVPTSIEYYGESVFAGCDNLKEITMPFVQWDYWNSEHITFGYFFGPAEVNEWGNYDYSADNVPATLKTVIINSAPDFGDYEYAFANCKHISNITLPNDVLSIPFFAFANCSSLINFSIPSSVTSISDMAFYGCSSLTSINVEEGNQYYKSIAGVLFNKDGTTLLTYPAGKTGTNYIIPNSVTSIEYHAFYDCSSLASITIPSSVISIGFAAFEGCSSLASMTIPSSVTNIGDSAFNYCSNLNVINVGEENQYYKSINGVLFNKDGTTLIKCPEGKTGSYIIPSSVTSIGHGAFGNCSSLETVAFENNSNLMNIGSSAFLGCSSLTNITIPSSVTSIGDNAFIRCSNLTSINVEEGNQYYKSINGVLFNKDGTILITCPNGRTESYIIPSGVISIVFAAFYGCSLTSITIPSSVTNVDAFAFYGWTASQTIYIKGRETAPDTWHSYWNSGCSANIVWNA